MSKFGWDLPPGCRSSDIPGNRPEDILAEKQYDEVYDALLPASSPETYEQAVENVMRMLNKAFEDGYQEALANEAEARSVIDDAVRSCPECGTPNQFGELCHRCIQEQTND